MKVEVEDEKGAWQGDILLVQQLLVVAVGASRTTFQILTMNFPPCHPLQHIMLSSE
jgi:hypothetical protein